MSFCKQHLLYLVFYIIIFTIRINVFSREIGHLVVIPVGTNRFRRNVVLNTQLPDQFSKNVEACKRYLAFPPQTIVFLKKVFEHGFIRSTKYQ